MRLLVKEIRSQAGELVFRRWRLLSTPWFSVYVHALYESDRDEHMHDHPWDFMSIILKGGYLENTLYRVKRYGRFDVIRHKAEDFHQLRLLHKPTWTLVITGPARRAWGYLVKGRFVGHEEYRKMKNRGELW
jgi:hypothetical protein